jgi:hypothetical protein
MRDRKRYAISKEKITEVYTEGKITKPKALSVDDSAICVVKMQGVERIWQWKDFQVLGSQWTLK